jgi:hypothetical protein
MSDTPYPDAPDFGPDPTDEELRVAEQQLDRLRVVLHARATAVLSTYFTGRRGSKALRFIARDRRAVIDQIASELAEGFTRHLAFDPAWPERLENLDKGREFHLLLPADVLLWQAAAGSSREARGAQRQLTARRTPGWNFAKVLERLCTLGAILDDADSPTGTRTAPGLVLVTLWVDGEAEAHFDDGSTVALEPVPRPAVPSVVSTKDFWDLDDKGQREWVRELLMEFSPANQKRWRWMEK